MWNLKKKGTNELIYKTESQMQKTNLWLPGSKGGGIYWEIGIDIHILLYIKDLLYSTGSSTQQSVMAYMGKNPKTEWIPFVSCQTQ